MVEDALHVFWPSRLQAQFEFDLAEEGTTAVPRVGNLDDVRVGIRDQFGDPRELARPGRQFDPTFEEAIRRARG